MKILLRSYLAAVLVALVLATSVAFTRAATSDATTSALSDADKAWKDLEKAMQPEMPPAEWQGQPTPGQRASFRAKQGEKAALAAEKAKDFYTRYPSHPKAAEA